MTICVLLAIARRYDRPAQDGQPNLAAVCMAGEDQAELRRKEIGACDVGHDIRAMLERDDVAFACAFEQPRSIASQPPPAIADLQMVLKAQNAEFPAVYYNHGNLVLKHTKAYAAKLYTDA